MNKEQLVRAMQASGAVPSYAAGERAVDAWIAVMLSEFRAIALEHRLRRDESEGGEYVEPKDRRRGPLGVAICIDGLGTFVMRWRTRKHRNPRTGEVIIKPPRLYVYFKGSWPIAEALV